MNDIDILQKQVKDLTNRVEKLEAQFTWNSNLDSDFNYIKAHPWDESPFEWTNYTNDIMFPDTSVSKKPENSTWKFTVDPAEY